MRIAKLHDVKFNGKMSALGTPAMVDYWIAKDDGEKFEVKVPNHPKILEAFEWMSDNDCLRHLHNVGPSYTHNASEVESIEYQNAMMEEHAHLVGVKKTFCVRTGGYVYQQPLGLLPVPERMFEVTWRFWSLEHAVMFKLAMGGSLED